MKNNDQSREVLVVDGGRKGGVNEEEVPSDWWPSAKPTTQSFLENLFLLFLIGLSLCTHSCRANTPGQQAKLHGL